MRTNSIDSNKNADLDVCLGVPINLAKLSFRTLNNVFSEHKENNNLPDSIFNHYGNQSSAASLKEQPAKL